jgi:hypothetical protein
MTAETATLTVRKLIRVELPLERAFELFTARIGSWWPAITHSIHKQDVRAIVWEARVGGRVYEIANGGEEADWATVRTWEPPTRFVLEWRVNPAEPATELEVRFVEEGDATRVELEHRGWEAHGAGAHDGYDSYDRGWDGVLSAYEDAAAA